MEDFPRRRTRATGFSPGGPRELTDAPRRPTRGGRRTTAVDIKVAAPTETRTATASKRTTRRAKDLSSESVDNTGVTDADVAPLARRGRGQTRSTRAITRSSSPSESIEPANRRSRSPQDAAARSPRPILKGRAKGRGKRAREEEIVEVSGSAENNGGDDLGAPGASRPAKRVRAGVRGGEELRKQLEQKKKSTPPAQAVSASSPVGQEASVSSVEVETTKNLGMFADTVASFARGSGGASPCTTTPLEAASPEAPLVIESIEAPMAGIDRPATLDDDAGAPVILHERTGEELIAEQRAAADLRKWVRLGRRNAPVMKAPSECDDEDEACRATFAFMEELKPAPLPTYQASKRYVEWAEGKRGMLVVEAAEEEDVDAAAKTRMIRRRFLQSSSLVPGDRPSKLVLLSTLIGDANILTALTTTLDWLHKNSDTVPTPDEVVQLLDKFKMGKRNVNPKVFRAPSPSDPLSSDDFDSDGEPIPRYRPRRVRKPSPVPAPLKPTFTGKADSHLPMIYRGVQFKLLPKELQDHPQSWKIKERDAIFAANSQTDAAEAAHSAKEARKAADAARKAAKETAEASRKPAQEAAEKSAIAASSTPTTPSQMSVSTLGSNDINKSILTGPNITPTTAIPRGTYGLFYGLNYSDSSDSEISDDEANKASRPVDATDKIRNTIPNVEISPQIEVIPRKPRIARPTTHQKPPPPVTEIKKLFMRKLFTAQQTPAPASAPTPTPEPEAPLTAPSTPLTFDISPEIQAIIDSDSLEAALDAIDNSDLLREFHRRLNDPKFAIDPSISAIVEEIPEEEFEPMMMELTSDNSPPRTDSEFPEFVIDTSISAIVESIPEEEFEPMMMELTSDNSPPPTDPEFVIDPSIWDIVNAIPDEEFDAMKMELNFDILPQTEPEFAIDPSIWAIVDAIPLGEFDPMMMDLPMVS